MDILWNKNNFRCIVYLNEKYSDWIRSSSCHNTFKRIFIKSSQIEQLLQCNGSASARYCIRIVRVHRIWLKCLFMCIDCTLSSIYIKSIYISMHCSSLSVCRGIIPTKADITIIAKPSTTLMMMIIVICIVHCFLLLFWCVFDLNFPMEPSWWLLWFCYCTKYHNKNWNEIKNTDFVYCLSFFEQNNNISACLPMRDFRMGTNASSCNLVISNVHF